MDLLKLLYKIFDVVFYDKVTFEQVDRTNGFGRTKSFGGPSTSISHLKNGSILYYQFYGRTLGGYWGKLQIMEFDKNPDKLIIRYQTWNFQGQSVKASGWQLLPDKDYVPFTFSLTPFSSKSVHFSWYIQDGMIFLNTDYDFYLVQPEDMIPKPVPVYHPPKPFIPKFKPNPSDPVENNKLYHSLNLSTIEHFENQMKEEPLGGMEDSPLHLKKGSIILYKANDNYYGKLQILAFGQNEGHLELYFRNTTYKQNGEILNSSEFTTFNQCCDNTKMHFSSYIRKRKNKKCGICFWIPDEFSWYENSELRPEIKNELLFLKSQYLKCCLLKEGTDVSLLKSNAPTIRWQYPSVNPYVTCENSIELKACVDIPKQIVDYKLFRNQKPIDIHISRGRESENTCLNSFQETVKLNLGDNEYQLQVTDAKKVIQSEVLKIRYDPNAPRLHALVIGNGAYTVKLRCPPNDADSMEVALGKLNFKVIKATNVTLKQMESLIDSFIKKLRKQDTGLFFYAGHGMQVGERNFLIPIDAQEMSLETADSDKKNCFDMQTLVNKMRDLNNRENIIFLEACRIDPFAHSPKIKFRVKHEPVKEGLSKMQATANMFIGFASGPNQVSREGEGNNSYFVEALLRHINIPYDSLDKMFDAVTKEVMEKTKNFQEPWKNASTPNGIRLWGR